MTTREVDFAQPPPPYRLRRAFNKDGVGVFTLITEILAEYGLSPDPEGVDADLEDLGANYFSDGGAFYILEEGEEAQIIGSVGIFPLDKGCCELRKMYLRKKVRGKGLGKFFMEFSLNEARRLGFQTMTLETATVLKEAIGLYTRYGFQQVGNDHLSARCDKTFTLTL